MKIDAQEFKKALEKISDAIPASSKLRTVLLIASNDNVAVCHSSGTFGVMQIVDCEVETVEVGAKFLLPLDKVIDIVNKCVSIGYIEADPIEITFENNIAMFKSVKRYGGDHDNAGQIASLMDYETALYNVADLKHALMVRADYWSVLENSAVGDEGIEVLDSSDGSDGSDGSGGSRSQGGQRIHDIWPTDKLVESLHIAGSNKNHVYLSKNMKLAFICTLSYMHTVDISDECINNSVIFNGPTAKAMESILKKVDIEELNLSIMDSRYCVIGDGESFVMWAEMSKGSKPDLGTLQRNTQDGMTETRMYVSRAALANIIESVISVNKQDKQRLALESDGSGEALVLKGFNGMVRSGVKVYLDAIKDEAGLLDKFNANVVLPAIKYTVDEFKGDYMKISIAPIVNDSSDIESATKYRLRLDDVVDDKVPRSIYTTAFRE